MDNNNNKSIIIIIINRIGEAKVIVSIMKRVNCQLIRMQCDVFEPDESIYYCFIYLILYRAAVLFESLPYCVPTISETGPNEAMSSAVDNKIDKLDPIDSKIIGSTNEQMDNLIGIVSHHSNESKYLNDDHHHQMNREKNYQSYGHKRMDQYNSADQSDYELERNRIGSSSTRRRTKKVLIQTRSCYCAMERESDSNVSNSETNVVHVNLTASETIVLHLIITSCPTTDTDDGDEPLQMSDHVDSLELSRTNYAIEEHHEEILATPSNLTLNRSNGESNVNTRLDTNTVTIKSKNNHGKTNHHHHNNNKRRKGNKKGKALANKTKSMEAVDVNTFINLTSSSTTTTTTTTMKSMTIDNSPTVCILWVDNPTDYNFKLDKIEPSMEWPLSEKHHDSIDFTSTIDLIDYLHKFPFLVVRNGQMSIDPRMNIENRTQTHYLRSSHLRFEALSSINVTLRFKRSTSTSSIHSHPSLTKHLPVNNSDHWTIALNTFHTVFNRSITFIANKLINYESSSTESPLSHWSPFHITSMLLSLFIIVTLIIYAVIAVYGHKMVHHHHHQQQERIVQIRTPPPDDDSSMVCHQIGEQSNAVVESSQIGRHESLTSFNVEQQSLEIDYYDYAVPLMMVHSNECLQPIKPSPNENETVNINGVNGPIETIFTAKQLVAVGHVATIRRSLEIRMQQHDQLPPPPPHAEAFRTLPIKVNPTNRNITTNVSVGSLPTTTIITTTTTSTVTNTFNTSTSTRGMINDHIGNVDSSSSASISTLTRLSFTKPPVLLSTFGQRANNQ
ncbi:hypothetical protein RDWZM_001529 [Blomia tropicalis]|uniref:Uncharacterized protein n=1 Tax=Blomia tropicalis TaxID=40697 RepID=A0A9Q0RQM9_BLOTA|nr:hypothetical protein RDWZM_001529 [Blomia tropicalis]